MKKTITILALVTLAFTVLGSSCGDNNGKRSMEDPKKAEARNYYNEGRRLFLTCDPNNYPKALAQFEQALKVSDDEEYPEALAAWAETLSIWAGFQINDTAFQTAMMKAQRAARLDPKLDMAYRAAADLFRHQLDPATGKYETDKALGTIKQAIDLNPDSAENWYVLGSIYLTIDPKIAIEHFENAKSLNPNLGKIYFNMGGAYQALAFQLINETGGDKDKLAAAQAEVSADFEKAVSNFETYQKMVPDDIAGMYALGTAYQNLSRFDMAEAMFKKTVSQPQSDDPFQNIWRVRAYVALTDIELKRNNSAAGKVYLERALQLDPKFPDALIRIVEVCKGLKDTECVNRYEEKIRDLSVREEERTKQMQAGSTTEPVPQPGATTAPAPTAPTPEPGTTGGGTP